MQSYRYDRRIRDDACDQRQSHWKPEICSAKPGMQQCPARAMCQSHGAMLRERQRRAGGRPPSRMIRKSDFMSQRHTQQGQEFVEFGLFAALFVVIALGIITFGHAFLVVNMITHAARDGARLAATWTPRAACHGLDSSNTGAGSTGAIQTVVTNKIAAVTTATMTVQVSQIPSQVGHTEGSCATPTGS